MDNRDFVVVAGCQKKFMNELTDFNIEALLSVHFFCVFLSLTLF